jgi:hypothetical protein
LPHPKREFCRVDARRGTHHPYRSQARVGVPVSRLLSWFRPRPAAPAISPVRADIYVRCYDNWCDFDDALRLLTPGGGGVWDGVAFVREDYPPPDWVGVFNHPGRRPVRISVSPNRVFFACGEPPGPPHRLMHLGQGEGTFVFTPDEDTARAGGHAREFILAPAMTRTWAVRRTIDELRRTQVSDKPLKLSWITSNLERLPGHRYRMEFLRRLCGQVAFDLFGRGFRPIADKWDALAPYRYSIAFENAQAPYYFTEKLMDCFVAETMPIYFGSPEIGRFFPPECMVILDPENPKALTEIAKLIESDLWSRRKDAILEAKRRVIEEYNIFSRLARFVKQRSGLSQAARRMKFVPVRAQVPRSD